MAIHRRLRQAAKKALAALPACGGHARKGPRNALRRAPRGEGPSIAERLAPIAAKALAGEHVVECAWQLFRLQYFPGWPHERVAAALGLWSTRQVCAGN